MAYRKSRRASSTRSRTYSRKSTKRVNRRGSYAARKPRRNNRPVRRAAGGRSQTIRLEIITSPQSASPIEGLQGMREVTQPKKAKF